MDTTDQVLQKLEFLNQKVAHQFSLRWKGHTPYITLDAYRHPVRFLAYDENGEPCPNSEPGLVVVAYAMVVTSVDIISGLETVVSFKDATLKPKECEDAMDMLANCLANNLGDQVKAGRGKIYQKTISDGGPEDGDAA